MELLKEWKGKIKETFKDVVGELDPAEKRLSDLVERATHEALPGPDHALNLDVVDEINSNPGVAIDAITRAIRRALLKPNPHQQLLALALLEMVVRNSLPAFFQHLATSELWAEMMRVGDPTRRWDPEVRDRILCLVEDFGRGLPMASYKESYESLVDRGVDFPARPLTEAEGGVSYYTPPQLPTRPAPYGAPPVVSPVPGGGQSPVIGADVSAEDAEAIRAAMAEMEAEEASRQLQAAHAAAAAQPPSGGGVGGAGPAPGLPAVPRSPRSIDQAVKVAGNSAELLTEMLQPLKDAAAAGGDTSGVREQFITDLADQCYRHRSVLSEVIPICESEELLSSALAANDDLSRALTAFEELSGARQQRSAGGAAPGGGVSSTAGPVASAAAVAGASGALAATFSLLDEGDEEEATELVTNRGQLGPPLAAAGGSSGGGIAAGGGVSSGGAAPGPVGSVPPLIDLDDVDVGAGASATAAALDADIAKLALEGKPAQPPQ